MNENNQPEGESVDKEMYYGTEGQWWKPEQWSRDSDGQEAYTIPYNKHPCYDTTDGIMPFGVRLQGVVIQARDRRLRTITQGLYLTDEDCYQLITNSDVRNAMAVWHEAELRGLDVRRVLGSIHNDKPDEMPSFESASELLSTGHDHHWVEVQHPESDHWWTIVAALNTTGEKTGTPYVGEVPPEGYQLYEDSREVISHRDLEHYLEMLSLDQFEL